MTLIWGCTWSVGDQWTEAVCWQSYTMTHFPLGSKLSHIHLREAPKHWKQSCNETRKTMKREEGSCCPWYWSLRQLYAQPTKLNQSYSVCCRWGFGASISMQLYRKICPWQIKCVTSQQREERLNFLKWKSKKSEEFCRPLSTIKKCLWETPVSTADNIYCYI